MSEFHSTLDAAADAELLTRVGIALTLRMPLTSQQVHPLVAGGEVTLQGELRSYYDRQLAIEITRRVAGVRRVRDELTVAPPKTATETADRPEAAQPKVAEAPLAEPRRKAAQSLAGALQAWASAAALGLLMAVGCGEAKVERTPVFPVTGQVTVKGQAAHGAIVALHPKAPLEGGAPNPRANVDKDGTFSVTTFDKGDGAPAGEYVVTVLWYKPIGKGNDVAPGPNVVPRKYATAATSDIVVKVAAGQNSIPPIKL